MKYYRFKDYTEEELLEMINNEYGPDSEYMEDYKEHFKKEIEEYNRIHNRRIKKVIRI